MENYSKKQIMPLIEKYRINPETNKVFNNIIKLFDGQTNYQIWAIKCVFEGIQSYEEIAAIKEWIDQNKNEIKNLIKGNVVSYKTVNDFDKLKKEITGLKIMSDVRDGVSMFNTRQRDMLKSFLFNGINNGFEAYGSSKLREWANILIKMRKLPKSRVENLIKTSSAVDDISFLKQHLTSSFSESYVWDKEDMLAFSAINTPKCETVYNNGDIVILRIPDFNSSKLLCGNGRTGWCITRKDSYFSNYTENKAQQYFLFNFGVREDDELAHVGFTVRKGQGIINAHSTRNFNLIGEGIKYKDQQMNINKVFSLLNVPQRIITPFDKLKRFQWNIESLLDFVEHNNTEIAISCKVGDKLILNALTSNGYDMLVEHTNCTAKFSNDCKYYIIYDLSLNYDDNKSVVVIGYKKDKYGCLSQFMMMDGYKSDLSKTSYLSDNGIETSMFLNRTNVNPSILLHKMIDEKNETEAIKLVEEDSNDLNVNYELENISPIFNVIRCKMYNLFEKIINHRSFDASTCDCFGETVLHSLIYNLLSDNSEEENKNLCKMIDIILRSKTFNFNQRDINLDTALISACDKPKTLWVVEKLVENPNVDVNVVDDIDCTALSNAIRRKNVDAIKVLARREDLIVRQRDIDLAEMAGVDLSQFFSREVLKSAKDNTIPFNTDDDEIVKTLADIFSQAFGLSKK